ncbi:hypothetical protein DDP54_15625 (plasmid) [Cellulomonas sp. WB94]|uniref:hypothetical protein n=1 Tax=Cellulomonas sp. WB94 TaxID=2173174 RepID=UPI000D570BD6|nr:hypothetical protein [Cellulomonas sp. WB94]PVU81329.1 hypothetical protein DDP54_15625 [Cellulomonas sp. WB94]
MNITPRKSETDPIVQLLESDAYPDAQKLAEAIVKTAFDALLRREWWLTVVDVDGLTIAYGLSPTERQAELAELGGGFRRMVLPVASAQGTLQRQATLEAPPKSSNTGPEPRARKPRGSAR